MKKLLFIIAIVALPTFLLTSCDKDNETKPDTEEKEGKEEEEKDKDENTPLEEKTQEIDARDYATWVYFSIETGEIVDIDQEKFSESLDWDIAFHRADVRLNGGKSGKGEGAAFKTDKNQLSDVTSAPEEEFVLDEITDIMTKLSFVAADQIIEQQPANTLMEWLDVDTSTPPPVYTKDDSVFIVKTASGKYAKMQFDSYRSAKNETMVITIKYVLQPNGSRTF